MKHKIKQCLDSNGICVYVICYKRYFWEFWKEIPEYSFYNENTAKYVCSRLEQGLKAW